MPSSDCLYRRVIRYLTLNPASSCTKSQYSRPHLAYKMPTMLRTHHFPYESLRAGCHTTRRRLFHEQLWKNGPKVIRFVACFAFGLPGRQHLTRPSSNLTSNHKRHFSKPYSDAANFGKKTRSRETNRKHFRDRERKSIEILTN